MSAYRDIQWRNPNIYHGEKPKTDPYSKMLWHGARFSNSNVCEEDRNKSAEYYKKFKKEWLEGEDELH